MQNIERTSDHFYSKKLPIFYSKKLPIFEWLTKAHIHWQNSMSHAHKKHMKSVWAGAGRRWRRRRRALRVCLGLAVMLPLAYGLLPL